MHQLHIINRLHLLCKNFEMLFIKPTPHLSQHTSCKDMTVDEMLVYIP